MRETNVRVMSRVVDGHGTLEAVESPEYAGHKRDCARDARDAFWWLHQVLPNDTIKEIAKLFEDWQDETVVWEDDKIDPRPGS